MNSAVAPQTSGIPKLPLWNTIGLAYSTYFRYFADVLSISWLWLILCAPLVAIANLAQWSFMAGVVAEMKRASPPMLAHQSMPIDVVALVNVSGLVGLIASVSIAVAWHRRIILGEHLRFSGSNVATKNFWRYVGIGLAISVTIVLALVFVILLSLLAGGMAAGRVNSGYTVLIPVIFILVFASSVAVILRLSLLFPARAVGDLELTFRQTWTSTRGNTWRLFWGIMACAVLPLLLIEFALLSLAGFPSPGSFQNEAFVRGMAVIGAISTLFYLLLLPIGIGFLSLAYRHFFGRAQSL